MALTDLIDEAFAPAAASTRNGSIPGAVLGLVTANGERAVQWAGHSQIEPEREPVSRDTWFDLASLTKVIFTTTLILHLVEEGRIALDDPLIKAIPDLRQYDMNAAERRLTFRGCLAHQTHLPGVEPLYTYGQDPETLRGPADVVDRNSADGGGEGVHHGLGEEGPLPLERPPRQHRPAAARGQRGQFLEEAALADAARTGERHEPHVVVGEEVDDGLELPLAADDRGEDRWQLNGSVHRRAGIAGPRCAGESLGEHGA